MFLTADPKDPVTLRINHAWHDASDVVDGILRGPADHIMRDPDQARCRLCGQSLTGNMLADQNAVANHRLVTAMDYAWSICDKFYVEKAELQKRALAKRREVEDLAKLANALRAEYPAQVHGYVMRSMHEPRERLSRVRQELEELHAVDGLGHGWEASAGIDTMSAVAQAVVGDNMDSQWLQYRESVDKRVALCSMQRGANAEVPLPANMFYLEALEAAEAAPGAVRDGFEALQDNLSQVRNGSGRAEVL